MDILTMIAAIFTLAAAARWLYRYQEGQEDRPATKARLIVWLSLFVAAMVFVGLGQFEVPGSHALAFAAIGAFIATGGLNILINTKAAFGPLN